MTFLSKNFNSRLRRTISRNKDGTLFVFETLYNSSEFTSKHNVYQRISIRPHGNTKQADSSRDVTHSRFKSRTR